MVSQLYCDVLKGSRTAASQVDKWEGLTINHEGGTGESTLQYLQIPKSIMFYLKDFICSSVSIKILYQTISSKSYP